VKWYTLAAKQGDADAQYFLGWMYDNGDGVPQDDKTALKWFTLAAKQGDAYARTYVKRLQEMMANTNNAPTVTAKKSSPPSLLGSVGNSESANYQKGLTAYDSGDFSTALREWEPLAQQGDADAQYFLGAMYFNGQGVSQDNKTAVKWYTLAAEQGDAYAQTNLGFMYNEGKGVPQDYKTAVKWYTLAVEQGYANAQNNLSRLQEKIEKSKNAPTVTAKKSSPPSLSSSDKENERLRKRIAELEKQNQSKPKQVAKKTPEPTPETKTSTSGSGFFVSKLGHVITNEHVVKDCKSVTLGDNANKQVAAKIVETDVRNDLALLKISSMEMASANTKTLVAKLGVKIVPLASQGLLRSDNVELGEDVVVAGFPFADIFSNTIKITKGVVSARRGMGNDSGQFQIDAAVQKGSSGGPIYDEKGNIIGVVVSQLNKLKVAKAIGSLPENVNFGIKASTVKQFLNLSGLPSSWSKRSKRMSTKDIAKIAENQTVMVMCHQ
jgi:S1-C subfamily serine protease